MSEYKNPMEQLAEAMKSAIPHIKSNKNGYEIRTKVLEMAQADVWNDYHAKWGQFEQSVKRDKDNKVIEGDPNKIKTVIDKWKFTRPTSSMSPNWYLAEIKNS